MKWTNWKSEWTHFSKVYIRVNKKIKDEQLVNSKYKDNKANKDSKTKREDWTRVILEKMFGHIWST